MQLAQLVVTATAIGEDLHTIQTHGYVRAGRKREGRVEEEEEEEEGGGERGGKGGVRGEGERGGRGGRGRRGGERRGEGRLINYISPTGGGVQGAGKPVSSEELFTRLTTQHSVCCADYCVSKRDSHLTGMEQRNRDCGHSSIHTYHIHVYTCPVMSAISDGR